jgi:acetyl-CoA/propionyl-CoA carboxylase biotin carboxyl carrier protein
VRIRADTGAADTQLVSPMPGTVVAVAAKTGDTVAEGDILLVVEAMKMEHAMRAPMDGIATVHVRTGDQVALDQRLATVEPAVR